MVRYPAGSSRNSPSAFGSFPSLQSGQVTSKWSSASSTVVRRFRAVRTWDRLPDGLVVEDDPAHRPDRRRRARRRLLGPDSQSHAQEDHDQRRIHKMMNVRHVHTSALSPSRLEREQILAFERRVAKRLSPPDASRASAPSSLLTGQLVFAGNSTHLGCRMQHKCDARQSISVGVIARAIQRDGVASMVALRESEPFHGTRRARPSATCAPNRGAPDGSAPSVPWNASRLLVRRRHRRVPPLLQSSGPGTACNDRGRLQVTERGA
jgi:hypothetical protein